MINRDRSIVSRGTSGRFLLLFVRKVQISKYCIAHLEELTFAHQKIRLHLLYCRNENDLSRRRDPSYSSVALHEILDTRHVRCLRITVAALPCQNRDTLPCDPILTKLHESLRARAPVVHCEISSIRGNRSAIWFCI